MPKEILIAPWQPLKWKPAYDLMVSLHVSGYSNVEIAEALDYSAVQVGNVLRSDIAQESIKAVRAKIQSSSADEIVDKVEKLKTASFKRIEEVLTNEELAEKSPFAMASAAMGFLKGVGSLSDGSTKVQNNFNAIVPATHMKDLISALTESADLRKKEQISDVSFREVISGGAGGAPRIADKSSQRDETKEASG